MAPLKVVCLISGGKDSLFSILHCLQNGHDVVALANLHPPQLQGEGQAEDLDSFMYQTVGHKIIPLYEQALGLPLYRQEIVGSAVNQSKSYDQAPTDSSEHQDETESLVPLLQKVKEYHPHLTAVSTGAILSDYQRTRVESVAIRLGLTPLSYLWQWPNLPPHGQCTLLQDMSGVGQDSRIIKVASGGLDDSFLWCDVADPRTISRLEKAIGRFGSGDDGAVLGEGGEYETLAVAGPAPLWKGRIEVSQEQMRTVFGEASSASTVIDAAQVVIKQDHSSDGPAVGAPPLLEPQFERILAEVQKMNEGPDDQDGSVLPSNHRSDHICYQNLTGPAGAPVQEQTAAIMDKQALTTLLGLQNPPLELSSIAYVSIILRRMANFAAINRIYTAAFTEPNPPARITLAEPSVLPEGKDVMVSFTCVRGGPSARQGLHVQSQSYWAPANIGPYSQAISVPTTYGQNEGSEHVVYVAGQIPLIPATMELAPPLTTEEDMGVCAEQAVLAAQHFVRIGRAMRVQRWACGIAFITASAMEDATAKARLARKTWEELHASHDETAVDEDEEDGDDFDIWNVRHGAQRNYGHASDTGTNRRPTRNAARPRLEVIRVDALPRGASIEWATYGLTSSDADSAPRVPHFEHLLEVFRDHILQ